MDQTVHAALKMAELLDEITRLKTLLPDCASIQFELLIEREARTQVQIKLDALVAAVLKCDSEHRTSEDWISLVQMARMWSKHN